uniref:WAP domain-containing protein n=2 Tax=Gadus TaxID=8048 RepID=A0A8C5ADD4_GADMO
MDNFINYFSSSFICITLVGDMNLRAQGPSGPWRCPQCMLKCRVRPTRSHCPVGAVLVVLKRVSLDLHMKMKSSVLSVLTIVMCAFFSTEFSVATETKENVTVASPKQGQCPRALPDEEPSIRGCTRDQDCPGGHKCCVFDCGAVCVAPAFRKPGVCPPRHWGVGMCAEFCSEDNDCPHHEKCCSNGCGHQCTAPYTVKPGRCLAPQPTNMCAEFCYQDGQCPGEQKCCRTTCGHACSEPC